MSTTFEQAREQQHAFKHPALMRYACAFVRAAMRQSGPFTADIVAEGEQPAGDTGIPGSAAAMLVKAHVLAPILVGSDMTGWTQLRRKSERPSRNGAAVTVYTLTSLAMAETFLRANHQAGEPRQQELAING